MEKQLGYSKITQIANDLIHMHEIIHLKIE